MENKTDNLSTAIEFEQKRIKNPGPLAAGMLFTLTALLLAYGRVLLKPFDNEFLRSGIGEVVFVLMPVLILLVIGKYIYGYDIIDTLKLKRIKPINYLIIFFMMLFAMPIVAVLNGLVLLLINAVFGKNLPVQQITIADIPTLLISILVIGVSAAVCEETLFRGLISKAYERIGVVGSLTVTSILFGILHMDIQKVVSTCILGAIIGFIVFKTKSLYAGMLAHFTNNTAVVLLTYGAAKASEKFQNINSKTQDFNLSELSNMPKGYIIIILVFYAILFLGCVGVFSALMYAFCRVNKQAIAPEAVSGEVNVENNQVLAVESTIETKKKNKSALIKGIIGVAPGVVLILLTFTSQLLYLIDVSSGPIYEFLKMIYIIK